MARKKNAEKEAPVKEKKHIFKKAKAAKAVETEVVDMDKKLAEIETVSGTGIQAFMREKIKQATKRG